MRTLVFRPVIDMSLWASLAGLAVAAGLAYLLYRPPEISRTRRLVVVALWWLGAAGPLALLLNPSWVQTQQADATKPHLVALIDTSASMATEDQAKKTRLEGALGDFRRAVGDLEEEFDVETLCFDDGVRPVGGDELAGMGAEGEITDIEGAIKEGLALLENQAGAMLLLSDGAHNASGGPEGAYGAARSAKALGVPIYTATYGGESSAKDVSIEVSSPCEVAFGGQEATISAMVCQSGFEGGVVRVRLSDGKEVIEEKDVAFGGRGRAPVEMTVKQDEPGTYMYELSVGSAPGEVTRLNNRGAFRLLVIDEAIKVLVLEGKPYWDFKLMLRALGRDPAVAVTGVVRLTEKRLLVREVAGEGGADGSEEVRQEVRIVTEAGGFLEDAERLRGYQVVILGRDTESFLSTAGLSNLKEWVGESGGTLLCARGKPMQIIPERMDALIPVRWSGGSEVRMRVKLTPFGQALRWFPACPAEVEGSLADKMPSLCTGSTVEETKPLTAVVARAGGTRDTTEMPAMSYQPYGSGRTLVVEGSGMWRWGFLSPRYEAYSDVYRFFWGSVLRWVVSSSEFLPSQTAAVKTSRPGFTTCEKAVFFVVLKAEEEEFSAVNPPAVEVVSDEGGEGFVVKTAPSGREMGLFRGVAGPLAEGYYQARLKRGGDGPSAECVFQVRSPLEEKLDLAARPVFMRRLARESGGVGLEGEGLGGVRSAFSEYWMRTHPAEVRESTAWDKLWVMMLAVVVWSTAWVVRRRGGLI